MGSDTTTGTSTQQVVTNIIANGVIFLVFLSGFLLLRLKLKRIYEPKSSYNLINDEKKPEPLPNGLFQWLLPLLKKSDNFIIQQAGLDGYFFIRYLFIISMYCGVSMIYIFPILFPINAANGKGETGLDQLGYSNVKHDKRYYAHVFIGWCFFWGFLFVIYRELVYYTSIRQAVLASPRYAKKLSSKTVLFQTVPNQYLDENEFSKLFDGVKKVWICRADPELEKLVKQRDDLVTKLENTQTKYIKSALKKVKKILKKDPNAEISSDITEYVKQRPTYKARFLIGKKYDTIDYIKQALPELNKKIEVMQAQHNEAKAWNSVFVLFVSQYQAQLAYQAVTHHQPLHMSPAYYGLEPADIVWFNMRMIWWERLVRTFGAIAAIVVMIIFWSLPVAFVGMISNITYLTDKLHWLKFIYKLPDQLLGLLTSLAPTVALSVLMSLLPVYIRKMAVISGSPTMQYIEYFTQQSYFGFQVIQVFLITTLTSSASSTVTQIVEKPTSAMSLLAENLPKSSNFYVAYIILQGFSISSGALLQLAPLIFFYVLGSLLDSTPRKKWNRFNTLSSMSWGTTFPVYTNIAVIIFSYSIISPIILLFGCVGFFLLYIAYLYNLTFVFKEAPDGRGMYYPRALFQTMVGLYIGQVCLLGLYAVGRGWGPIVLQVVCLCITVFVHINLNHAFDKLMTVIPIDTMKPLDGTSDTPSFSNIYCKNKGKKSDVQELPKFEIRKYKPENVNNNPSKMNNGSFISTNTFEIPQNYDEDNENNILTAPLLADGDTAPIPPASWWKRFLLPHIYMSYKMAKFKLPEIYSLPDPNEFTEEDQIEHAYDIPAVSAKCPSVWIPKDPYGFSTMLINEVSAVVNISDKGALINEKGQITWSQNPPNEDGVQDENEEKGINDGGDSTDELEYGQIKFEDTGALDVNYNDVGRNPDVERNPNDDKNPFRD
ncbi:Rsn1p SCDLUD_001289 [Saccharomycodes ludwigii]|uniref:Rsn1p n=1 Tax=Saccharomycodes ludwigii TaxID=36035 RepID=UPI001E8493B0|nr:hypothetical protein SCDLUD_001289 [Saccharomycodes ludwigii]KAH3903644.1 hypothetical protein SCDLUD_001289 [Saccharomycodes ludwigii]